MRVALLESRPALVERVSESLSLYGLKTHPYPDLPSFTKSLHRETFDLLVIAWRTEGMQHANAVKELRDIQPRTPLLVVADHYDEDHLVRALWQGADDFMVNPYRLGEMAARVGALLRRSLPHAARTSLWPYELDESARSVVVRGAAVELADREYELASILFRYLGQAVSRAHLRERLWSEPVAHTSRSLDVVASRVRKKLSLDGSNGFSLSAVYGLGYCIEPS